MASTVGFFVLFLLVVAGVARGIGPRSGVGMLRVDIIVNLFDLCWCSRASKVDPKYIYNILYFLFTIAMIY